MPRAFPAESPRARKTCATRAAALHSVRARRGRDADQKSPIRYAIALACAVNVTRASSRTTGGQVSSVSGLAGGIDGISSSALAHTRRMPREISAAIADVANEMRARRKLCAPRQVGAALR